MAYVEYEYDDIEHLPSNVQCIVASSHSVTAAKKTCYLGCNKPAPENAVVSIELITSTDQQAIDFYMWFQNSIENGTKPFSAKHEIFGKLDYYVLQMIDGITENIVSGDIRNITFSAEIIGTTYPIYEIGNLREVLSTGRIRIDTIPDSIAD